ncbi:hypothetical protein SB766_06775 [Pseudomonas sp. SIMBA_077]
MSLVPSGHAPACVKSALVAPKQTFFVVSIKKFLLMYFMTGGLYLIVWFFEHWKQYRKSTGVKVWPAGRTSFGVLMVFSLFWKIHKALCESGLTYRWFPLIRAILIIVLGGYYLLTALRPTSPGMPASYYVISPLLMLVMGFLLVGAQRAVNFLEGDPAGERNSKLSVANGIWITLGSVVWACWVLVVYLAFTSQL